jgi:hypothetical protein
LCESNKNKNLTTEDTEKITKYLCVLPKDILKKDILWKKKAKEIVSCCIKVHPTLRPGLLEGIFYKF